MYMRSDGSYLFIIKPIILSGGIKSDQELDPHGIILLQLCRSVAISTVNGYDQESAYGNNISDSLPLRYIRIII